MKLIPQERFRAPSRQVAATTLFEFMISVGVFGFIITGLVTANIIGMKEDQLMESKAGASDSSRRLLETMVQDIHSANTWDIGTIANPAGITTNSFQVVNSGNTVNLQGNAIRLYPNSTGSTVIFYYFDSSDAANSDVRLTRWISTNSATTTVICSNLMGAPLFVGEDYLGNIKEANDDFYLVIHTQLHFCQFQYPMTMVGSNYLFNSYTIDVRATPYLPQR